MSASGCPAHPRPVRPSADPSSGRSARSQILVPRPWSRCAGSSAFRGFAGALGPSWQDPRHLRRTFRRWSRPLTPRSGFPNDPSAAPRPAASSHYPPAGHDSAILTRAPSCVSCARRAVSAVAADRSGSAFMLTSGSVWLLSISHHYSLARVRAWSRSAPVPASWPRRSASN